MAIGNSPNQATTNNTTTNNQGAGASAAAGGDVYGNAISGNTGNITTSDFGAVKAASDIALSGLQSSQAASQEAAQTVQDALNKVQALGSQTSSGGLTTVLVPAVWIGGGVLAAYFLYKAFKKG